MYRSPIWSAATFASCIGQKRAFRKRRAIPKKWVEPTRQTCPVIAIEDGSFQPRAAQSRPSGYGPGPDIIRLPAGWWVQPRQTKRRLPMKTKWVGDGAPGFAANEPEHRLEFRGSAGARHRSALRNLDLASMISTARNTLICRAERLRRPAAGRAAAIAPRALSGRCARADSCGSTRLGSSNPLPSSPP